MNTLPIRRVTCEAARRALGAMNFFIVQLSTRVVDVQTIFMTVSSASPIRTSTPRASSSAFRKGFALLHRWGMLHMQSPEYGEREGASFHISARLTGRPIAQNLERVLCESECLGNLAHCRQS